MNKILLILFFFQLTFIGFTQPSNEELISLAKIYRSYHFTNQPNNQVFEQLASVESDELKPSANFLTELIKTNNSIISSQYLTKPDEKTLQNLFIIRSINWNLREADPLDNDYLIDSLKNSQTDYLELLACYYNMIWVSVANKNRPLNMSTVNFNLDEY